MPIIEINDLSHPGVEVYGRLTEAQLRNRLDPGRGIFVAESPKVIAVALNAGYEPLSLLCERRHITGDAAPLIARCGDLPVYTGEREVLAKLTGYTLTRGVLCAMRRPAPPDLESVCRGAARVAVMDGVVDSTNVGAIFRSVLRPLQPPRGARVDGFGVSRAMDLVGWRRGKAPRFGLPNSGDGPD